MPPNDQPVNPNAEVDPNVHQPKAVPIDNETRDTGTEPPKLENDRSQDPSAPTEGGHGEGPSGVTGGNEGGSTAPGGNPAAGPR